ncbi:MAG: GxxExxY protein [Patescibacteria group bacterium]
MFKKETETVIGMLYDVFNTLGWGYREKYYERAIVEEVQSKNIACSRQVRKKIMYKNKLIGYNYADLLIFDKILLELKVGTRLIKKDFDQLNEYLRENNIQIGLLVLFSPAGVVVRRLANVKH